MARITHVLCPIDFSAFSRHAFARALAVARPHRATVTALHVFPTPSAVAAGVVPFGPEGPGPFALHHLDQEKLTQELIEFVSIDPSLGVPVDFKVIEGRSTFREILEQADLLPADLIVMGTHGHSGLDRLILGSVTEKVLRRASMPVLTVPAGAPDVAPAATVPFRRILCATDFSDSSHASLNYASSLAEEADADLTVIHVVELLPVVYEPSVATPFDVERGRPSLEEAARRHLHQFVPESVRLRSNVEEVVTSGKAYVEILKVAAARDADLIVLGVHGHNALDRLLFGSTANHVVRRATCPVLTVRPHGNGQ
jgi:nucleotide-binding universal stress UspA family protein